MPIPYGATMAECVPSDMPTQNSYRKPRREVEALGSCFSARGVPGDSGDRPGVGESSLTPQPGLCTRPPPPPTLPPPEPPSKFHWLQNTTSVNDDHTRQLHSVDFCAALTSLPSWSRRREPVKSDLEPQGPSRPLVPAGPCPGAVSEAPGQRCPHGVLDPWEASPGPWIRWHGMAIFRLCSRHTDRCLFRSNPDQARPSRCALNEA